MSKDQTERDISMKEFKAMTPEQRSAYLEQHSDLKATIESVASEAQRVAAAGIAPIVVSQLPQLVSADRVSTLAERMSAWLPKPAVSFYSEALTNSLAKIGEGFRERQQLCEELAEAFKDEAAKRRFAEWFQTSEQTVGERGAHTYAKLAQLLDVSEPTAKSYVKGKTSLSAEAVSGLMWSIGRGQAYDLAKGEGAYAASEERKRIEGLRSDIKQAVDELPPEHLEAVLAMLQGVSATRI